MIWYSQLLTIFQFVVIHTVKGFSLGASLVVQLVKSLLAMKQTQVQSLGCEDPLEKELANYSSILALENLMGREQIVNIHWVIEKQESSRKISTSASLTTLKPLIVWLTINCGKFFKRWEYQTTWAASWEICMQVKKQQLKLDMEQQTGSK